MECNDAGEILGFSDLNLASNSFTGIAQSGGLVAFADRPDTIFLCPNDSFVVNFDLSAPFDISGDPDKSTPGGIGFAYYRCIPTVTGPIAENVYDDCIVNDGTDPFDDFTIAISRNYADATPNYDIFIDNFITGVTPINDFFPGGSPQVFTYAPITFDAVDENFAGIYEDDPTQTPPYKCVDVSVDQNFTVAFMNPITVTTSVISGCQGSFRIRGGAPELRQGEGYTFVIENTVTSERALILAPQSSIRHNSTVNYRVPSPGEYRITGTDEKSCQLVSRIVTHSGVCNTDITATAQDETCDGNDDGSIVVSVPAGQSSATVQFRLASATSFGGDRELTSLPNTAVISPLAPGDYAVRAVYPDGSFSNVTTVTVDPGLKFAVTLDAFAQPTCNGDADGSVRATVSVNGVRLTNPESAGYTFSWAGTTSTNDTLFNLPAGSYAVTVTGPRGVCTEPASGGLDQSPPVNIITSSMAGGPVSSTDPATCSGSGDGSITVLVEGGSGPYTFDWPDPIPDNSDPSQSTRPNLDPGDYIVSVTDLNGCFAEEEFTVTAAKLLVINATVVPIACFGDANATISITGEVTGQAGAARVGNFFVSIENLTTGITVPEIEIIDDAIPTLFSGLDVGRYVITLRDEDPAMCATTDTFDIGQPDLLVLDEDFMTEDETCEFGTDGSATASVTGGTAPYEYRWVNDSLETPLDTITPGPLLGGQVADSNYVVTVTDARGCTVIDTFRINSLPNAQILVNNGSVDCPGDENGQLSATITPPPGETIVSIFWFRLNPADTTIVDTVAITAATAANLTPGPYAIEVIVSNQCPSTQLAFITSPEEVFLQNFTVINPDCASGPGNDNGTISVTPGGGTPNADGSYNYSWSNGVSSTNPILSNLTEGDYSVTITDANNCQPAFDTTFTIAAPPAITGEFTITPVSCPDDSTANGTATFAAIFGDGTPGNFAFTWSDGTSGSGTSSTIANLTRGPVSVTVTDGLCERVFEDSITSPENFVVEPLVTSVSCNGDANGSVTLNATGGTGAYAYEWLDFPTETDETLTDLTAGIYRAVLTDANGCSPDTISSGITEPDVLDLAIDSSLTTPSVACIGDSNGLISVFVNSANNNDFGPMPYTWSAGVADSATTIATDLAPGTYGVTLTDVNGCQDSISYAISEPDSITFSYLPIEDIACFGETTQIIIDTAFGGTAASFSDYTFTINNDGFRIRADTPGEAFAGPITIAIFDAVGCSSEQTDSIGQPEQIVIDLEDEITIELGDTLTRLNPVVSPPGGLYNYRWTPADSLSNDSIRDPRIFSFVDVAYTLEVTDGNNCQAFADIFVNVDANRNIYIPTAFSPNQDGRNDDFRVFACQGVRRVSSVQIFNRWGGLVFEGEDLPPDCLSGIQLWNGEMPNGKLVNPGVFVYVVEVEFLDNITLPYRGEFTLLR